MLSQENIKKLVMTGLYRHEPDKKYRPQLYWNDLYHCYNWTFTVKHNKDTDQWYMVDTYYHEKSIELTNENFEEFELIFDVNEVEPYSGKNISDYNEKDWWQVPVDSAGLLHGGKYFLRKNAVKNKDHVLQRLDDEIKYLERELQRKKEIYQLVQQDDTINLKYI